MAKVKFLRNQDILEKKLVGNRQARRLHNIKQIRLLNKIMTSREKLVIKICAGVVVASAAFMIYANFIRVAPTAAAFGGQYTEGVVGDPLYINPLYSQANEADQDLSRLIFNGLVRYDKDYQLIPDLAESWQISEDQKEYTFKMRAGVQWHDGENLTVQDVLFTFQSILDPNVKSPLSRSFSGVKVEITSEDQIKFTLTEPFAGFMQNLTVGIIPQHLWAEIPAANYQLAQLNQKPVGSGPYKFLSFLKDKNGHIISYTLTANKKYHLKEANLEKITLDFFGDYITAMEALKNKQVQGLSFIPKEYLLEVTKRNLNVQSIPVTQFTSIFLNPSKNELLKDSLLKSSLKMATNKQQILEDVLQSQGSLLHGPILPGFPGYDAALTDEYNPAKAQQQLIDGGWKLNEEGFLTKKDSVLSITMTTIDQPDTVKLVKMLQDQWQQIGVKVDLSIQSKNDFAKITLPGRDYQVLVLGAIVNYDGDPFSFWHSSQRDYPGINLSQYNSRRADELLEEVRKTSDQTKRGELYAEIQKIIIADEPAIFLYTTTYSYPVDKEIKGNEIKRLTLPSDRFWNITDWYTKTKKVWK